MMFWFAGLFVQMGLIAHKVYSVTETSWWLVLLPIEIIAGLAVLFVASLLLAGAFNRNPFQ